jgi:hypothetical protein
MNAAVFDAIFRESGDLFKKPTWEDVLACRTTTE